MQEPDVEDDTAIHTITYSLKFCVVWSVIVFFFCDFKLDYKHFTFVYLDGGFSCTQAGPHHVVFEISVDILKFVLP